MARSKPAPGATQTAVAPTLEPIAFWPASSVRPDADFAGFDAKFPSGADIVIVPAMLDAEDPAMLEWLRAQEAKGALMVSICEGASVMAAAGILDGKRATGHFYEHENRVERYGAVDWQRNRLVRLPEAEGQGEAAVTLASPATLREDFLAFIAEDRGEGTAGFVATQLEYPRN